MNSSLLKEGEWIQSLPTGGGFIMPSFYKEEHSLEEMWQFAFAGLDCVTKDRFLKFPLLLKTIQKQNSASLHTSRVQRKNGEELGKIFHRYTISNKKGSKVQTILEHVDTANLATIS